MNGADTSPSDESQGNDLRLGMSHIPFMVFNGLHPNDIEFKSMCDKMLENRKNNKMGKRSERKDRRNK